MTVSASRAGKVEAAKSALLPAVGTTADKETEDLFSFVRWIQAGAHWGLAHWTIRARVVT